MVMPKQIEEFLLEAESRIQVRVSFLDCDSMNIVRFNQYLVYFEAGLIDLLRRLGFEAGQVFYEKGLAFPVREVTVKYHRPAHFDDVIEIVSNLQSVGTTSVVTRSKAYLGEDLLAEGTSVRVCVNAHTGQKIPLTEVFDGLA